MQKNGFIRLEKGSYMEKVIKEYEEIHFKLKKTVTYSDSLNKNRGIYFDEKGFKQSEGEYNSKGEKIGVWEYYKERGEFSMYVKYVNGEPSEFRIDFEPCK